MKTWKKVLIGVGIFVVMIASAVGYVFMQQKNDIDNLHFSTIDMELVKDGLYDAEVETTLIKVELRVEVKNHSIVDIKILKHDNGLGSQAEMITKNMEDKNNYDVDTISGATLSSKVVKSAVNQALEKGL